MVPHILNKVMLLLHMLRSFARNLVSESKLHRLVDGESREVDVI
jgi:hypothetical protein